MLSTWCKKLCRNSAGGLFLSMKESLHVENDWLEPAQSVCVFVCVQSQTPDIRLLFEEACLANSVPEALDNLDNKHCLFQTLLPAPAGQDRGL